MLETACLVEAFANLPSIDLYKMLGSVFLHTTVCRTEVSKREKVEKETHYRIFKVPNT